MSEPDRIELRGLRLAGRIGVSEAERSVEQPLEVDIDISLDLAPAGSSDDLGDTLDYGAACQRVAEVVATTRPALLERLAADMADAVLAIDDRVQAVTVVMRKLDPPVAHALASAGVRVTRPG